MKRTLFICLSVYFTIVACNGLITPPTGPGTEYPCGVWGVECSKKETGTMCCPQKHICGGGSFSRCEPGFCCYDGDDWPNWSIKDSDAGKAKGEKPSPSLQYQVISIQRGGQ